LLIPIALILGLGGSFLIQSSQDLQKLQIRSNPKKDIGIQKSKKTPFGKEVSVI
jgi:hypothetical protein